jgi:hypothetical protein
LFLHVISTFGKDNKNVHFYKKNIQMTALENIKNSLIDRILATKNENLLKAIDKIFTSTQSDEVVTLNATQINILSLSEADITEGKLVSDSELKKRDAKWLN